MNFDPNEFISLQKKLIEQEREIEKDEIANRISEFSALELQKMGYALLNLRITAMRSGLGGKSIVDFESGMEGMSPLVSNKFRSGDIVAVELYSAKQRSQKGASSSENSKSIITGVIYRTTEFKIVIAFTDELPESMDCGFKITKLGNEVTYQRMLKALDELDSSINKNETEFAHFFTKKDFFNQNVKLNNFFNPRLNHSQKEAIQFAIDSPLIALVHGPPGTGKTHTCVEIIRQLVSMKQRVLVCGPSNISVDNIVERLSTCKIDMVRLGHAARVLPSVLDHSLDVRSRTSEEGQLVNDMRQEIDQILSSISKTKNRTEKRQKYQEIKLLKKELIQREAKVISTILGNAQVVLCTLNGAASKKLDIIVKEKGLFDVVLIDEASQALEAECWIAMLKAKKLILAGDHLQLPPTVKSKNSVNLKKGLKVIDTRLTLEFTLFDRLMEIYGPGIKKMLDTQYRMNEEIMTFSSKFLYESKLKADESVKDRILPDLDYIEETDDTLPPMIFVDTSGFNLNESIPEQTTASLDRGDSKMNEGEAEIIEKHLSSLVQSGLDPSEIAIISPYNGQVSLLISMLHQKYNHLEIGSVDGFQGREKEAIILSMVRSNEEGEVGFLSDKRRLNVAITRPKRQLFVVGDGETLSRGDPFLNMWVQWLHEHAETRFP